MFTSTFSGGKELFKGTPFVKTTEVQPSPRNKAPHPTTNNSPHSETKRASPKSNPGTSNIGTGTNLSTVTAQPTSSSTGSTSSVTATTSSSSSSGILSSTMTTSRRISGIFSFIDDLSGGGTNSSSASTSDAAVIGEPRSSAPAIPSKPTQNVYKDILRKSCGEIIEELGLNEGGIKTRNALYDLFQRLCESPPGGSSSNASAELQTFVSLEKFVVGMIKKGYEPLWSDAAFKAFSAAKPGRLNSFEFVVAATALDTQNEEYVRNPTWQVLRRHLVFTYYNHRSDGRMTEGEFHEMMSDLASAANHGNGNNVLVNTIAAAGGSNVTTNPNSNSNPPSLASISLAHFGLVFENKQSSTGVDETALLAAASRLLSSTTEGEDRNLVEILVDTRVELAQRCADYDELMLRHLQLERSLCEVKLQLAKLKENEVSVQYSST